MTEKTDKKEDGAMEVVPPSSAYYAAAEAKSLEFMNPKRWQVMQAMATTFISSGAVPESIKNAAQMMMVFQAGYEAGMQPLESLNAFYIVNGKLTMYGDAVTSQVIRAGHKVEWGICSSLVANVTITRGDNGATMTGTFTVIEAREKGLLFYANGNENVFWKKYPENMLKYKALGKIVDFIVPDALRGVSVKEVIEADMGDVKGTSPLAVVSQSIVSDTTPTSSTTSDTPATQPAAARPSLADALAAKPTPVEPKTPPIEDKKPVKNTVKTDAK